MVRPLRIEFSGALYHVISRGNEQRPIVRDDTDRRKRLDWLRRTVETYGWRLHAFVLMGNHEHLFVETPEANLSAGMQYLNGSYTSYFNRRHGRAGHLFQGRFRGHLVEQEGYFLEISRYIHLNPVRARLVRRPEQFPWSSYAGYRQARRSLPWLTYGRVLGEFAQSEEAARRAYVRFVQAGMAEGLSSPFSGAVGGLLVGSAKFVARIQGLLKGRPADHALVDLKRLRARPTIERIVEVVCGHFDCDPAQWSQGTRSDDAARALAAYLARRRCGYPATAVAEVLGYRGPSGVSHAVRRIEAGPESLRTLAAELERTLQ